MKQDLKAFAVCSLIINVKVPVFQDSVMFQKAYTIIIKIKPTCDVLKNISSVY